MRGGGGGRSMLREVKIGRWSEGDRGEEEMVGLRCVSEEVMTRSRMWFCV